jgi:hypothetical protein
MYALNTDFSTSATKLATSSQSNHNFTSRRELEFQSALENYLTEYHRKFDASVKCVGCNQASLMRKLVNWIRR